MKQNIIIIEPNEAVLVKELQLREDIKAERIKRLLALPDLSRTDGSPIKAVVNRVLQIPEFADFDVIQIPEIISTKILFDLFGFADTHPARSESDTYYVDKEHVLRTHDTVFWYYYLNHPEIKKRLENNESFGTFCFGKVYRKDEIDRHHMNVFHQFGGLYLVPENKKDLSIEDLKQALSLIVKSVFGPNVNFRFVDETFPYTDPSTEIEVEINGKWMEIVGSGMAKQTILANFGVKGYKAWAFGFGLERLAIIKMGIPDIRIFWSDDERITGQLKDLDNKYKEVSKYPETSRDISFIIDKNINLNNYYEIVRDFVPMTTSSRIHDGKAVGTENYVPIIEEVKLVDEFENDEKFGKDKKSYTFRIVYRSPERTLTSEEVNAIQEQIREKTKTDLNAVLR
jgi:phenylalanyl-tRNA synthetase alpha chain